MKRSIRALALSGATFLALLPATPTFAHGDENVGELSIGIGFGTEPAYAGMPNSVQVLLEHDGQPVTDAKGLTVEVAFGDVTTRFDLEPNFVMGVSGEPGDYRAWFVPSQVGPYTFRVTGEVDGEGVDVEMTSGPDTFTEVQDTLDAAFPAVDAPSNDELADRLEAEGARVAAAQAAAQQAADDASSIRSLAVIALVVGSIGVIAAVAALASGRKA